MKLLRALHVIRPVSRGRAPLLMICGLILLSITVMPRNPSVAHAAGFPGGPGRVCMVDPSSAPVPPANPCPPTPYTFTGPYPSSPQIAPTQIRIGVFVNGSAAMNGFEVTLKSNDTSVLVPAYFDVTGSILPSPYTVRGCVNGILVAGARCDATDVYGTVHVYGIAGLGLITTSPTTGLLFTSIWDIVGNSGASGVGISFQTGCSNTSVAPDVCVTVSNGTLSPVSETVQTGNTFLNPRPVTVPWIALTSIPNASALSVSKGSAVSIVVTANAMNGWPVFSNDLVSFSSQITFPFVAPSFSATSCATGGTRCSTTVTLNTATAGSYVLSILGSYAAIDNNSTGFGTGLSDTLVASLRFNINTIPFDFSIVNRGNVTIPQGGRGSNTIILTLLNGTAQSVNLACSGLPLGASCIFNPSSGLPTSANTFATSTSSPTPTGSFLITVTGTGGGLSHATRFTLTVITPGAIGGTILPVNKLGLLAPYMIFASLAGAGIGVILFTSLRKRGPLSNSKSLPL